MEMAEFLSLHSFTFMYYCTSEKGNKEKMNSNFIIPLYILIISFTIIHAHYRYKILQLNHYDKDDKEKVHNNNNNKTAW